MINICQFEPYICQFIYYVCLTNIIYKLTNITQKLTNKKNVILQKDEKTRSFIKPNVKKGLFTTISMLHLNQGAYFL